MTVNEMPSANFRLKVFKDSSSTLETKVNDWLETANVLVLGIEYHPADQYSYGTCIVAYKPQ